MALIGLSERERPVNWSKILGKEATRQVVIRTL